MQGAEYQVTGFGGGQRKADGFQVAQLTNEDDVRVFTQRGAQGVSKTLRVAVYLALVHQAFFRFVHEFDRVFDSKDVFVAVFVDVV